ncbi:hypothetical protein PGT21_008073 [Puccinia graminis f. sp. tritici]|nr:hypothetical protein PGT21_008073 [Puccinia graminis f. sp. tritici]
MITILLSCITFLNLPPIILGHGGSSSKLQTRPIVVRPNALRNFEIREPPVVPRSKACDQLLLKYVKIVQFTRALVLRPTITFQVLHLRLNFGANKILKSHVQNFANSYGKPGNASYLPPKDCGQPGDWASVIFNLTIS